MAGGHSHDHPHASDYGRSFAIGISLNLGFVLVETVYGFLAGSMALIADAGHNLSDVLGLVVAWAGSMMARTSPSRAFHASSAVEYTPTSAAPYSSPKIRVYALTTSLATYRILLVTPTGVTPLPLLIAVLSIADGAVAVTLPTRLHRRSAGGAAGWPQL